METEARTGHAVNVANLESLIAYCTEMGVDYNPVNQTITLSNLTIKLGAANDVMQIVKDAFTNQEIATNARSIEFKTVNEFSTQLINALIACGANTKTIANARTIVRKFSGKRARNTPAPKPIVNENPLTETEKIIKKISVSQQGVDSKLDNLKKLATLLKKEPLYIPNEIYLKNAAVAKKILDLTTFNSAVIAVIPIYFNSLSERDTILYAEKTGLVDLALLVKAYVLSILTASNPDYKKVNAIHFRNFR